MLMYQKQGKHQSVVGLEINMVLEHFSCKGNITSHPLLPPAIRQTQHLLLTPIVRPPFALGLTRIMCTQVIMFLSRPLYKPAAGDKNALGKCVPVSGLGTVQNKQCPMIPTRCFGVALF